MKNNAVARVRAFIKGNKRVVLAVALILIAAAILLAGSGGGSAASSETDGFEERLEEMCSSLEGVGSCRVMVTYKSSESRYGASSERVVESVAVVCKGAERAGVRRELTEMLSSLFGIGANRIHISKMK